MIISRPAASTDTAVAPIPARSIIAAEKNKPSPTSSVPLVRLCIFVLVTAMLSACSTAGVTNTKPELTRDIRTDFLGTAIMISAYDKISTKTFDEAFSVVADIDAKMSVNKPDSEISTINNAAGTGIVNVSDETRSLIQTATALSATSGGAFDISVGAVMELWKADGVFCVLPDEGEIEMKQALVGYQNIQIGEDGVGLGLSGMKLDLGAIAKGYACDKALEYLKSQGIQSAMLDFGGNIYAHGTKPDGTTWNVGVRAPFPDENEPICVVSVQDVSVVTSGGYERNFEENGTVYHHILDPKTGYPAQSGLLAVTIVDVSSTRADALSTACFVLGLAEGYRLLETQEGSEGIFVTADYTIVLTPGLVGRVTLQDERFAIVDDYQVH